MILEKEVLRLLKDAIDSSDVQFELKHRKPEETTLEISAIEEKISRLSLKEKRIKDSYREGIDTIEEYRENKQLIQEERNRLEAQLQELKEAHTVQNQEDLTEKMLKNISSVYEVVSSDDYSISDKNEALKQIVEKIIFDRENNTIKLYYYYCL